MPGEPAEDAASAVARAVAAGLASGSIATRADLHRAKQEAVRGGGLGAPPADRDVAARLPIALRESHAALLRTKPTRSRSGVAVVAVMSSPASCPHGKCTFCPGGPEVDAPQSYTGFEPSTMRAARLGYDPYRIVRSRLGQLQRNGHPVGKVEAVVQGGTFPARDPLYQEWFVAGIYAACNDGPGDGSWMGEAEWAALGAGASRARLLGLMRGNESAACRVVGLTIETKPDWCLEPHVDAMLALGATRIEVGLQALDDAVLQATHRGHTLQDSRDALRIARDAGFKLCAHMMPGLPRPSATTPAEPRSGATAETASASTGWPARKGALDPDAEADLDDFRRLFADPEFRPDMLKVYPTLVVQEGETTLKRQWQRGDYHPYDTATAARLVALAKSHVPAWCRIQRVDRDIPTTHVEAGVMHSNLRQLAQAERARLGLPPCRCIRCREAGRAEESDSSVVRVDGHGGEGGGGRNGATLELALARTDYEASGGNETFLSFEDPARDVLMAFLRLRRVSSRAHRPECAVPGGAAFVRELKAYGEATDVGEESATGSYQHRGLGTRLLREAERIAFGEWGVGRLLVIAGPGVKPYYRARGYRDCGPYVAKEPARGLDLPPRPPA